MAEKIEQLFVAAAFAEGGDVQAAEEVLRERPRERRRDRLSMRVGLRLQAPSMRRK